MRNSRGRWLGALALAALALQPAHAVAVDVNYDIDRFADQKELNEFGHDVAVDNGIKVEIFASQAEADAWLTGRNE